MGYFHTFLDILSTVASIQDGIMRATNGICRVLFDAAIAFGSDYGNQFDFFKIRLWTVMVQL